MWDESIAAITSFLRVHLDGSGAKGVILGLSGGLDSAVVADLACRAYGVERVRVVAMPADDSNPEDLAHAKLVATHLGLRLEEQPIGPIVAGVQEMLSPDAAVLANCKSRARMLVLYALAQTDGLLVLGTGNKSELLTGYFTKHGDGGHDLLPIGDLYKSQVFELARHLGLPAEVIDKPPSAGLGPGQTDEADLGMDYGSLDQVLQLVERDATSAEILAKLPIDEASLDSILTRVRNTEHKRRLSLIPKLGLRTIGLDWRRPVQWRGPP